MIMMDGRRYAACGQCVALVPADTGCPHWKPSISAASALRNARTERQKSRRARQDEALKQARADRDRLMRAMTL